MGNRKIDLYKHAQVIVDKKFKNNFMMEKFASPTCHAEVTGYPQKRAVTSLPAHVHKKWTQGHKV